jgi:hypothetical protein
VNLSWTPGADVTHITYANTNDAENIQTINLTDEEKAAGKYTLAGLQPTSTYTITISSMRVCEMTVTSLEREYL